MAHTIRHSKYWIIFVLAAGIILSVLLGIVSAASTTASADFSLSGGGQVSQSFSVKSGEGLSLDYIVTSSNETSCFSIKASVEGSPSQPVEMVFRGLPIQIPANSSIHKVQEIPVNASGTLNLSFDPCSAVPPCKGKVSIQASYSIQASSQTLAEKTLPTWGAGLAGLVLGFIGGTLFLDWYLLSRKIWINRKNLQPAGSGT